MPAQRPTPSCPWRQRLCAAAAVVFCGLSACRTVAPIAPFDLSQPGWEVRQGQGVWRLAGSGREITGDLVLATQPPARSFLQFSKTPLPLVTARRENEAWTVEFVPEGRTLSGHGSPPRRLLWLHLAAACAGRALPAGLSCRVEADSTVVLTNLHTGESITAYF